mgnify:CR=1 FL=1
MKVQSDLQAVPMVMTKENVLTSSYMRVLQTYFINLSAFRRFIVNVHSRKELKYKIKTHVSRNNELFSLNRTHVTQQADCLALFRMAETLRNNECQ